MSLLKIGLITVVYPFYYAYLWVLDAPIYRRYPLLIWIECQMGIYYFFLYPFFRHLLEKIKTKKDLSELVYGETPYATLELALDTIRSYCSDFPKKMVFFDLGCGKGKLVFYMAHRYGIPSIGIDIIPTFIRYASSLSSRFLDLPATFLNQDILETDLSEGTLFFMASTCFLDTTHAKLSHCFSLLPKGIWLICTGAPIHHSDFEIIQEWQPHFSWGKGYLVLQRKTV